MNKKHHSGVFLMEMTAVVFFFILCASVCILVFVKADRLSRNASDLNQGIFIAQSVGEIWKARGMDGLSECFGDGYEAEDGSRRMGFDRAGNGTDTENTVYQAAAKAEGQDGNTLTVTVSRDGEQICELTVMRHETAEEGRFPDGEAKD